MVKPYYADDSVTLHHGQVLDVLRSMPAGSVDCIVTSPPYWGLRDYGVAGQHGNEPTPAEYVATIAAVFAEAKRVLAVDGSLWLNLGDTYSGKGNAGASVGRTRRADRAELIPHRVNATGDAPYKSLLMLPERIALALIEQGWTLRNRIIWHKPSAMPESVTDRFANRHEALFLFAKSDRYWFDLDAVREPHTMQQQRRRTVTHNYNPPSDQPEHRGLHRVRPEVHHDGHPAGRNPGDVWSIPTVPFPEAHFAVFPPALAERCMLAGCRPGGVVLDTYCGSGTTGMVATKHGRRFVGIDLSEEYLRLALRTRLAQGVLVEAAS